MTRLAGLALAAVLALAVAPRMLPTPSSRARRRTASYRGLMVIGRPRRASQPGSFIASR